MKENPWTAQELNEMQKIEDRMGARLHYQSSMKQGVERNYLVKAKGLSSGPNTRKFCREKPAMIKFARTATINIAQNPTTVFNEEK